MMSKDRIQKALGTVDALTEEEIQRAHSFLNVLSVFEAEIACHTKSWSRISEIVEVSPHCSAGNTARILTVYS